MFVVQHGQEPWPSCTCQSYQQSHTLRAIHSKSASLHAVHLQGRPGNPESPDHGSPHSASPPVAVALEVEVEVQDAALKGALEALLVRVLPLLVQDLEGDVLVGWARLEDQQACATVLVCIGILDVSMLNVSVARSHSACEVEPDRHEVVQAMSSIFISSATLDATDCAAWFVMLQGMLLSQAYTPLLQMLLMQPYHCSLRAAPEHNKTE